MITKDIYKFYGNCFLVKFNDLFVPDLVDYLTKKDIKAVIRSDVYNRVTYVVLVNTWNSKVLTLNLDLNGKGFIKLDTLTVGYLFEALNLDFGNYQFIYL